MNSYFLFQHAIPVEKENKGVAFGFGKHNVFRRFESDNGIEGFVWRAEASKLLLKKYLVDSALLYKFELQEKAAIWLAEGILNSPKFHTIFQFNRNCNMDSEAKYCRAGLSDAKIYYPLLADKNRYNAYELILAYRTRLLFEIFGHYSEVMKQKDRIYSKRELINMANALQSQKRFYPICLATRTAVSISKNQDPLNMALSKGSDIQQFGCFFFVFC